MSQMATDLSPCASGRRGAVRTPKNIRFPARLVNIKDFGTVFLCMLCTLQARNAKWPSRSTCWGSAAHGELFKRNSAEQNRPRTLLRIRPGIFDFEPELGLKRSQTKPKISATVPTDQHTTIPNDSGSISVRFDDDPKLSNCKIVAQPRNYANWQARRF